MGDQDAKRDIFNFSGKVEGGVTFNNHPTPVRSRAEQDLLATVRRWVEARLAGQLRHNVKLNLHKQTQPQQVRPWRMEVKVAIAQPSQLFPPETTIGQVFDQCSGQLLILGEPGAGKTTSLLDLALELVARAENDPQQRIPVMVDLADWQPTVPEAASKWGRVASILPGFREKNRPAPSEPAPVWSISDWLVAKVREKYGFLPQQIQQWLEEKQLVPLLDGLDEVRPEYQQDCVRAINQWLNSDLRPRQVALCCRREQYEAYLEKLELEGAVYLQDLTDEQIQAFLQGANRAKLWESLVAEAELLALIRRPLLLSMAILAYGELEPTQWQGATSAGDRLNLLLDAYVRRMLMQETSSHFYRKGNKIPSPEQTRKWLEILAWQLEKNSEREFLIEETQPSWFLTRRQQWIYVSIFVLISGLINGLLAGFIAGFSFGLIISLVSGIIAALSAMGNISTVVVIQVLISSEFRYELRKVLINKLITGSRNYSSLKIFRTLLVAGIFFTFTSFIGTLIGSWLFGLFFGFFFIVYLILAGLLTIQIDKFARKPAFPNQGIWNLTQSSVFFTLFWVLSWFLIRDWVWYLHEQYFWFYYTLIGAYCGLLVADSTLVSSQNCLRHFLLRLVLFVTGLIPWNYACFLNYATERLLLQRIGGRYQFVHDLLQKYFVQQWLETQPTINRPQEIANRGRVYRAMKQYDSALQDFSNLIERKPKNSKAFVGRGTTYRLMERYEEAQQDFNRAIELNPKYDWAIANRGETYRLMERYEEALPDFNRAIELDPKYTWAIASRGQTYYLMERYEDALQDFNRAIELNPNYTSALTSREKTYRLMGRYEEALQDANRLIELNPIYAWAIAETYRLMGRYEEALQIFNRLIELDPKVGWVIANRGETYRLMKRYEEALQDFNRAIELYPQYTFPIISRGRVYREMRQYDSALQDFSNMIECEPKNSEAFASRGFTYGLMERYEEALQDFNRAIELNPKYQWAIANRGETCRLMKRYEEALQDFNRAIELDPKYTWAIASRGETCRLMERYEEALPDFNRLIELDSKYAWAIASRGRIYLLMGRYEEALPDFNRAIELDHKYEWAFAGRGETYYLMKRYEEALPDFNRLIELDSKYAWAIASRGQTYLLMERYEEAMQDFNRAIELDPKNDWAIRCRGYIYLLWGRYEEALKDLNFAIELSAEHEFSFYHRALAYLALHQPDSAKADLDTAINLAQQQYTEKPENCQNTFNLALFHLVAGNLSTAKEFYQTALQRKPSHSKIREAIQDLEELLKVLGDVPSARQMIEELKQHLK